MQSVKKILFADRYRGDFYLTKPHLCDQQFFSETWTESCLVFVVNLSLCRTPEWGSLVFQAGDTDFVAAACAETDRPVCFICKAASQKTQARRVLCTTPLLQPNCDEVPLSKLLCILGAQEMGKTLWMVGRQSWTFLGICFFLTQLIGAWMAASF